MDHISQINVALMWFSFSFFLSFFLSFLLSFTNLVHGLPLTNHQRSLAHHMDSCTILTVALHLRLQFPSPIALTIHALNTQLIALNTLLIALNTQLIALNTHLIALIRQPTQTMDFLFLSSEYCLVFSILLMLATYQAFPCLFLCSVFCIVLHFSLSECYLLYGAIPSFHFLF